LFNAVAAKVRFPWGGIPERNRANADVEHVLWHRDSDVLAGKPRPHFHALYAEHEALIDIQPLEVIEGSLPRRALALVLQ
jgi:hypothetical protein